MIAPPITKPRLMANVVTIGRYAFRATWRLRTFRADRPFARAVKMKSSPRTSSIEVCIKRIVPAAVIRTRASIGRAPCIKISTIWNSTLPCVREGKCWLVQFGSLYPLRGNQGKCNGGNSTNANAHSKMRPIQNEGML